MNTVLKDISQESLLIDALNQKPLEYISLKNLNDEQAFDFGAMIKRNKNLTSLDIDNISDNGFSDIIQLITEENNIQYLTLGNSNAQLSDASAIMMTTQLHKFKQLKNLQMSGKWMGPEAINVMNMAQRDYKTTYKKNIKINVTSGVIKDCSLDELEQIEFIPSNCENLIIGDNQYDSTQNYDYVLASISTNKYLKNITTTKESLDPYLQHTLFESLKHNTTLKELYMTQNSFDKKSFDSLLEAIESNKSLEELRLYQFSIISSNTDEQFKKTILNTLFNALKKNESLKTLVVTNSDDTDDPNSAHKSTHLGESIMYALMANDTLKHLQLLSIGLNDQDAINIANALKINSSLEQIDISDNPISANGINAIEQATAFNNDVTVSYTVPKSIKACLNTTKNTFSQCLSKEKTITTTLWHWLTYPLHLNALVIILVFGMGLGGVYLKRKFR